ncbi:MAG: alpha-mannosidase [Acidimicrobiales bacterium]|nr:alpha-mannosidase [Acidimicrobiales bacterium]
MTRQVNIVPHTHWDREWYRPFPSFRMQLVELLDQLLPALEADPGYAHFMLDGQMAVIDDYLEVRPHERDRIRRLAAAGRLSVGPWYILMDEFLVSGETMVRNLRLGLDRAAAFGGAMEVGYLPDMFGHVAQMPQLLAQFGFSDAVVWRGVPFAVDAEAFRWVAPDGSAVRAEYLSDGYSNGALLPTDAKDLVDRIDDFCRNQGPLVGDPVLWMNGTDHLMPQAWLGRVVAEANEVQSEYHLAVTSLAAHLAGATTEGLPTWTGELRSGARTNLLMGVASNRVDVKQAAAIAERAVERMAEPLAALFLPADAWPGAFLDRAWLELIRNSAHDSICACSVDETNAAVIHRYTEATRTAEGVADRAVARVLVDSGEPLVVVNPTQRERSGMVELIVPGAEAPAGTQVLSARPAHERLDTLSRTTALAVVMRAANEDVRVGEITIDEGAAGDPIVITLHTDRRPRRIRTRDLRDRLRALAAADPDGPVHLEVSRTPTQLVLTRATAVPGFGWRGWAPAELDVTPVTATGFTLANGLVSVEVDPADGTWSIDGVAGYGRLVDDGDAGDTYNWSPPATDTVVDRPATVAVSVGEAGPVRARLVVDTTYRWPARADSQARTGEVTATVRTTLELRAGEDLLRVTVDVDNQATDHRLRTWFPLTEPTASSQAECAFGVVERGLEAEGGETEVGLPTFPSRRFVVAGGLTVTHEGLCEYELVDVRGEGDAARAHALALTLLRCTGVISGPPLAMRAVPAGPPTPTPGAQMRGPQQLRYALHTAGRDPYAVTDDAWVPLLVGRHRGAPPLGDGTARGQALRVTGAEVSAVTRTAGRLEVRVFNPTDQEVTVRLDGRTGWQVDLRGRATEPFDGSCALRPWGVQTFVLDD